MECMEPCKRESQLEKFNRRKENVNQDRLAGLEMRWGRIGNSGSQHKWQKVWIWLKWSVEGQRCLMGTLQHTPVLSGALLPCLSATGSFLSLILTGLWLQSPPIDNSLLMGRYAHSSLSPQYLPWCPAYNVFLLNISCIQERRIAVCYSESKQGYRLWR